jgi:hypothetical protein
MLFTNNTVTKQCVRLLYTPLVLENYLNVAEEEIACKAISDGAQGVYNFRICDKRRYY